MCKRIKVKNVTPQEMGSLSVIDRSGFMVDLCSLPQLEHSQHFSDHVCKITILDNFCINFALLLVILFLLNWKLHIYSDSEYFY